MYLFGTMYFFNCLVIFCNITNGMRGLICPLQEPETLLMSLIFSFILATQCIQTSRQSVQVGVVGRKLHTFVQ